MKRQALVVGHRLGLLTEHDAQTDIAAVRIDETNLPTARLGDSDKIRVGEWVLAIGNPMGHALLFSVTAGIVSAIDRSMATIASGSVQEYIQTDLAP